MKTRTMMFALALGGSLPASADNWSSWRGDLLGSGAAPAAKGLPASLVPEKNAVFKTSLPGPGNSTPVIWGDRIFLTCGIDGKDAVVAYDFVAIAVGYLLKDDPYPALAALAQRCGEMPAFADTVFKPG